MKQYVLSSSDMYVIYRCSLALTVAQPFVYDDELMLNVLRCHLTY